MFPWFRAKTTREYFDCDQFDRVAEIVGVKLAAQNRYCMRSHVGSKALVNHRTRTIRFDKKWFLGLSPRARCAVLVHELWHISPEKKAIRARTLWRLYRFIGLPLLSLCGVWVIVGLASILIRNTVFLSVSWPILFLILVVEGYSYGLRWCGWPLEYECDEAAVRFMGLEATKEFLRTIRLKSSRTAHPPTRKRLDRANRVASQFPVPVINFDSLERKVSQNLIIR